MYKNVIYNRIGNHNHMIDVEDLKVGYDFGTV